MYRVGIIGLGRKASTIDDEAEVRWLTNYDVNPSTHTSAYLACRQTKIIAVCSRTVESCQRWKERWKQEDVRCYTDYREMLAKEELDIVSICTHADLHAEITIEAARAGVKGIICEKAMATSLEEADRMIYETERLGVKLLINHPRRYHPTYHKAKHLLDDGAIGNLHSMRGTMWTYVVHNGTHLFDMLCYYAAEPNWAQGFVRTDATSDPGGYGLVQFRSDVHAFVDVTYPQGFTLELHGSGGLMRIDTFTDGVHLWQYEDEVPRTPDQPYYQFRKRRIKHEEHFSNPTIFTPPMQAAVQDLIDSIEQDRPPLSNANCARDALEIGLALHASMLMEGARIAIPQHDRTLRVVSR